MLTKRQGIVVWFQHMKNIKQLKRHGHLVFVSKKLKYAMIYVNLEEAEEREAVLNKLPFVSKTALSYRPFIRTDFENAKQDKAKEYDYKIGI
ncbi:hypothetical protein CHI12_10955 [Terribacillus saccharophilus]|uniref:Uncharacterized protein n=1 Tax=Terribacillus saccharophilus TaxID=361277 RepID=A0A268HCJ6_9BACI|nr:MULTISPECIES: DUF2129 domain-containing protein [Terribacillus]PAD37221.1 hypothetical protein CHH56_00330 [Terribacillus saccharophilus]PAD97317.1 hypothetical protein CHH50_01035 [Terribacillus saccharophilus]PAE01365.1 hypothetical protein CHH48_01025 [Terribacillus saccharophilus]PAE07550.1 hypothetical protein CHI12_10955 [Terribacillus saccharophilus]VVM32754.1 hypothetical protein [Terribacillus sp. AE2B 122]